MNLRLLITLVVCFGYALLRYAAFGDVPLARAPVYLLNKATSVAAVCFILYAGIARWRGAADRSRTWGKCATVTAGIHVLLSLSILNPAYFSRFHEEDGHLNLGGELIILAGSLATVIYVLLNRPTIAENAPLRERLIRLAVLLVLLHLVPMGVPGWVRPATWHGGLPPISLISALLCLAALAAYLPRRPGAGSAS